LDDGLEPALDGQPGSFSDPPKEDRHGELKQDENNRREDLTECDSE
jgi:hypothetical protein